MIMLCIRGTKEVPRKGVRTSVNLRDKTTESKAQSKQVLLTTPVPWDPLSSL